MSPLMHKGRALDATKTFFAFAKTPQERGLEGFSDGKFSDTIFPTANFPTQIFRRQIFRRQIFRQTNFPKPHFPTTNFPTDIFSDNQNYFSIQRTNRNIAA